MAGETADQLADEIADAHVRRLQVPEGLNKADATAFRNAAWQTTWAAAREVTGKLLDARRTLADLQERVEWLEVQQADRLAQYGGGGNG